MAAPLARNINDISLIGAKLSLVLYQFAADAGGETASTDARLLGNDVSSFCSALSTLGTFLTRPDSRSYYLPMFPRIRAMNDNCLDIFSHVLDVVQSLRMALRGEWSEIYGDMDEPSGDTMQRPQVQYLIANLESYKHLVNWMLAAVGAAHRCSQKNRYTTRQETFSDDELLLQSHSATHSASLIELEDLEQEMDDEFNADCDVYPKTDPTLPLSNGSSVTSSSRTSTSSRSGATQSRSNPSTARTSASSTSLSSLSASLAALDITTMAASLLQEIAELRLRSACQQDAPTSINTQMSRAHADDHDMARRWASWVVSRGQAVARERGEQEEEGEDHQSEHDDLLSASREATVSSRNHPRVDDANNGRSKEADVAAASDNASASRRDSWVSNLSDFSSASSYEWLNHSDTSVAKGAEASPRSGSQSRPRGRADSATSNNSAETRNAADKARRVAVNKWARGLEYNRTSSETAISPLQFEKANPPPKPRGDSSSEPTHPVPTSPDSHSRRHLTRAASATKPPSDTRRSATAGRPTATATTVSLPPPSPASSPRPSQTGGDSSSGGGSGSGSSEIFKSMHCTIDDPCHAVLAKAVRKYGIPFDWRDYTLVISTTSCVRTDAHGGTYCRGEDRAILPDEKPLRLFKELDKQGLKPMFLLRRKEFVGEDAKRAE